jgi:hypothetical protein
VMVALGQFLVRNVARCLAPQILAGRHRVCAMVRQSPPNSRRVSPGKSAAPERAILRYKRRWHGP